MGDQAHPHRGTGSRRPSLTVAVTTGFDPFDPGTLQCPFPHWARLRADEPVATLPIGITMVTRHDLVSEVLRDTATWSSAFGGISMPMPKEQRSALADVIADGYPRVPTLLTADPPAHTRYRRLVSRAFTPRAVASWEPVIREIAVRLVESWLPSAGGTATVELLERFAVPLPVEVIARALGVSDDRLDDFKRWSDDSVAGVGTALSFEARLAAERGVNELQHHFAAELERRRAEPTDDLLSALVHASIEDDPSAGDDLDDRRPLDLPELLGIIQQLLVAGNETTTKLLGETMRMLAERPEVWAALRGDPSRIPAVIEESLRLATPVQGMFRVATRDTVLGGVPLAAGSRVVAVFGSANRDESVFTEPESFVPGRPDVSEHLAFGKGIHHCLGANLARLEARVALEELVRRIATVRVHDPDSLTYHPSFLLRGLVRLDLDVTT